ncbi:MAG: chemotaxis protein CheW [Spirochaetes bacterium]|nr:chemotaxis protein CheW [Spirochaetota bacterium]
MSFMDDPEIRDTILYEIEQRLEQYKEDLNNLEKDPSNNEFIKKIFRYIHTIKSNSGMIECKELTGFSHKLEDLLGIMRDKSIKPTEEILNICKESHSCSSEILTKLKQKKKIDTNTETLIEKINKAIQYCQNSKEALSGDNDIVADVTKEFVNTENIRVNLNKVDNLINLLGELHLTNRMHFSQFYELKKMLLSDKKNTNRNLALLMDELENKILKFNYLFDEFRNDLLNVRMIKVSSLFNRFPKVVVDLSEKLNKKIGISFEGEETEIDKRILEEAAEPILHIIRNAIDHGIESPEVRVQNKKKKLGMINIKTYPRGGSIIIEINDDGKGIDSKSIKKKLLEKGMYTKKELTNLSEKEIINSIFIPGFSTKEEVSHISGRGIGMDIVSEKVKDLKGEIEIDSDLNKGTTFKIILPMTLTIIEGFSVTVNKEEYIFIKDDVKFLLKIEKPQLHNLVNKTIVDYEDSVIPIYSLKDIFSNSKSSIKKMKADESINLVVLRQKDNFYGFQVDAFNGIKSIVLKNIGTHINKLSIFEGATINEEGNVVMVISKSGLIQKGLNYYEKNKSLSG